MKNNGPKTRAGRTSGLRNDTRSLLRSRTFQVMLTGVAGLQVVGVAAGNAPHQARYRAAAQAEQPDLAQTMALSLTPVVVAKPIKAAVEVKVVETRAAETKAEDADEAKVAVADELAESYRKRGFDVPPRLARQIHEIALENDIDPKVAFGLVKTESGFKNSATSHVGAIGLTQLMPATARWLKPGVTRSDLRNSETNLRIGFRYLRDLIEKYDGNTRLALLAYNRGPGTVDRVLKRGGNPDNGYYDMVMGRRNSHR